MKVVKTETKEKQITILEILEQDGTNGKMDKHQLTTFPMNEVVN